MTRRQMRVGNSVENRCIRVYYALDRAKFDEPELCVVHRQRIVRYSHAPGARVKDVLVGFRERNKNKIREALKSISDQIAD